MKRFYALVPVPKRYLSTFEFIQPSLSVMEQCIILLCNSLREFFFLSRSLLIFLFEQMLLVQIQNPVFPLLP